jgi:anti-sigma factor RsiW
MAMCPDNEHLSLYIDDEIPSPWKERMESHLRTCRRCSERVTALRSLSSTLRLATSGKELAKLEEAKVRIAARLYSEASYSSPTLKEKLSDRFIGMWSRKISMPMPFLAAGILMIVFLAGITMGIITPFTTAARYMATASKTLQANQASYENMVQYIKQTTLQPIMIEMPNESVLNRFGTPVLVSYGEPVIQELTTNTYASGLNR